MRLGALDQMIGTVYVPQAFFFEKTLDAAELRRSLVAVLAGFPALAGRLAVGPDGRWLVRPTGRGVPFSVAASARRWAGWGVDAPMGPELAGCFHPTVSVLSQRRDAPLLAVRLHTLQGGGSILAVSVHHAIADAAGIGLFMRAWSRVHRGLEVSAIDHDRLGLEARLLACPPEPGGDASPAIELVPRRRVVACMARLAVGLARGESVFVDLPARSLDALRAALGRELGSGPRLSAHDAATAALWTVLEPLRPPGAPRCASVIVDLRARLSPRLAPGYFGNACVSIFKRSGPDLRGAARRAVAIRETLLELRDGHAAANVQATRAGLSGPRRALPAVLEALARGGFMFNSWARNGAYEVDFGAGPPAWFEPSPGAGVPGLVIFMPSPRADGGLVARVSLERGGLAQLRRRFGARLGPSLLAAAVS